SIHCTSEEEASESAMIFPLVRTVVIPNGVDLPDRVEHHEAPGQFRALYLGRFDPKKGLENLLTAWARLVATASDVRWMLTLAGTGERTYVASIREQVRNLRLESSVSLVGEVLGEEKERLFWNSDILVMPSYTENFAVVVAEALAHAVPVISSRG